MLAARFVSPGAPLVVTEVPDPVAPKDGVVIQVETAGVCGTDAHLWAGDWDWAGIRLTLPATLGHEVAGRVVKVGAEARNHDIGDRVIVPFHLSCGRCRQCQSGLSNLCENAGYLGSTHDGAFAEYMAVPNAELNALRLPSSISFDDAAALGCRYMTAFRGLVDLAQAEAGEWLVVIGAAGGVGRAALQLADALGVTTIAVDRAIRLEELTAVANHAMDIDDPNLRMQISDITGGGAQVALDAVAKPLTASAAIGSLRKSGRLVQVGLTGPESRGSLLVPMDEVVHRELRIFGVSGNPHIRFDPLLSLVSNGRCKPSNLVTRTVDLHEVSAVLESMRHYGTSGMVVAHPQYSRD